MSVRRLLPADAPHCRALMLDAYARHPDAFTSTVAERAALPLPWWEQRLAAGEAVDSLVLGAFDAQGSLVGAAGLAFESRVRSRHKATLFGMVVQRNAQGTGQGTALVKALLDVASQRPALQQVQLTVTEGNAPALRLYARCGFRAFGREPMAVATDDGRLLAKIHMACDLRAPQPSAAPRQGALRLLGIHRASIVCSDYARARRFYVQTLGLVVLAETQCAESGSWTLELGLPDGGRIELCSRSSPLSRPARPDAQGLRLLAFAVSDLDASLLTFQTLGVPCQTVCVDAHTGRRWVGFSDPDGLPLQLCESASRDGTHAH